MKRIIAILAICLMLSSPSKSVEVDKVAHFSASYLICDVGHTILNGLSKLDESKRPLNLRDRIIIVAAVNVVGIYKEASDPVYDRGDTWANALGSVLWLLKMQVKF